MAAEKKGRWGREVKLPGLEPLNKDGAAGILVALVTARDLVHARQDTQHRTGRPLAPGAAHDNG